MKIVEMLKSNIGIRIEYGYRWLIYNNINNEWEVWERKKYARDSGTILLTKDESKAVEKLIN